MKVLSIDLLPIAIAGALAHAAQRFAIDHVHAF
jgi:hypothetical protein